MLPFDISYLTLACDETEPPLMKCMENSVEADLAEAQAESEAMAETLFPGNQDLVDYLHEVNGYFFRRSPRR